MQQAASFVSQFLSRPLSDATIIELACSAVEVYGTKATDMM